MLLSDWIILNNKFTVSGRYKSDKYFWTTTKEGPKKVIQSENNLSIPKEFNTKLTNWRGEKNIDNKLIIKPTKIKKSKLNLWTLVISDKQGKYYLEKISINKLWDGLYSSPIFLCQEDLETWAKAHNLINQLDKGVRKFNHKLSHHDICFSVMSCNLDANKNISLLDDNWYNLSEINKGVPKFQFKAVESIS